MGGEWTGDPNVWIHLARTSVVVVVLHRRRTKVRARSRLLRSELTGQRCTSATRVSRIPRTHKCVFGLEHFVRPVSLDHPLAAALLTISMLRRGNSVAPRPGVDACTVCFVFRPVASVHMIHEHLY